MKIALIIVTYNRIDTLKETLKHINNQTLVPDYICIVDNGSALSIRKELRSLQNNYSGKYDLLFLSENEGYGAGLSKGMIFMLSEIYDITHFWLMDDDSHPREHALKTLIGINKINENPAIIGSTGFINSVLKGPIKFSSFNSNLKPKYNKFQNTYEVDSVLIDGALVDIELINKIGTPREDLFMMCEDYEYSKRAKSNGFDILLYDDESLMKRLHQGGGIRFSKNTLWRGYYHSRNHLSILKNYFSFSDLLMYVIRQSKYLIASVRAKDFYLRIKLRLLGVYHGLKGVSGKTINPSNFK